MTVPAAVSASRHEVRTAVKQVFEERKA